MSKLPNIVQLQTEIDNNLPNYKLESFLGKGNNSYIYRGTTSNNHIYLIKFIPKTNDYKKEIIEIGFMKALSLFRNSQNYINTCHDFSLGQKYIIVIMNVFYGQDIGNFCHKIKDLYEDDYIGIIKQIIKHSLKSLSYIHKRGIAHQNLNLYSIVISCPDNKNIKYLKFVDFGNSCGNYLNINSKKFETHKCNQIMRRMNKLPPEYHKKDELVKQIQKIIKTNNKDNIELYMAKKDDIWVLGTMFWLLVNRKSVGENPFSVAFPENYDYHEFRGHSKLEKLHHFIVNNILVDVQKRKNANEILNKFMLLEKYGWEYQN